MRDWRAIYFAVQGCTIRGLTNDERHMVLRRLNHRLPANDEDHNKPGLITVDVLAHRLGVTPRTIERDKDTLPPAQPMQCPVCGNQMWLHTDGFVEPHPDSLMLECPLSEFDLPTVDDHDLLLITVRWLAGWMKADPHGAVEHLESLDPLRQGQILVAALGAIPEESPEQLYAWADAS